MKSPVRNCVAAALGALLTSIAAAADTDTVARVNGQAIPQIAVDALVAEQKARGATESPELRNAIREELITREVVLQEARRLGLDKNASVAVQAELARQTVILGAMTQAYGRSQQVSQDEIQAAYENLKLRAGTTEYRARHIFLASEADARAVVADLARGEKFETLVKKSQDNVTRERGGDLGWINPTSAIQPAIINAAMGLAKGKHTEAPVRAGGGYHVVLLEDTRPITLPSLEQVSGQLAQRIIQERWNRYVADLRAKAKVD